MAERTKVLSTIAALAVLAAGWFVLQLLAGRTRFEMMGALRLPNRCSVTVEGLDRSSLTIETFGSRLPRPKRIFDGRSCDWFVPQHGSGDPWGFYIRYDGEVICRATEVGYARIGGDLYRFRCVRNTGGVACSATRGDGPVGTVCGDTAMGE